MAFGGGLALKGLSLFLRIIEFCCAATILGIFSYFLATLHNHALHIDTYIRAVEGISGAAVIYTTFALLLVCFLGGIKFLSAIAMFLDLCFAGAFAYVAYANRGGDGSCKGFVNTPFGSGQVNGDQSVASNSNGFTELPSLHTACKLETACFAVAIVAAVFFILSILVEFALIRHHKREKAFGPSPNNGYTAGSPRRRFWQRGRRNRNRDAEFAAEKPDALPAHQTPADFRTSYATDTTAVGNEPAYNKYGNYTKSANMNMTGAGAAAGAYGHQTTTTTHYGGGYMPYRGDDTAGTF